MKSTLKQVKVLFIDGGESVFKNVELVDFHDGFLSLFNHEQGIAEHLNLTLIHRIFVHPMPEKEPKKVINLNEPGTYKGDFTEGSAA